VISMLKADFTEIDITPPPGLRLGGYMQRLGLPARGHKDPLYARILQLEQGDVELAIVQLDLLGVYRDLADLVKSTIHKATGIREVMVTTTHTHSAPETIIPMWPNTLPYSEEEKRLLNTWISNLIEKIEASIKTSTVEPVESLYLCYTDIGELCYNRAFPGELYDSKISVLVVKTPRWRLVLYSTPCHPVCNTDLYYSADYHSHIVRVLRNEGYRALSLTGAAGDVDPVKKGYEYAEYMGIEISRRILRAIVNCKAVKASLSAITSEIEVPTRRVNYEDALKIFREVYWKYADLFRAERLKGNVDPEYFKIFEELIYADQELEVAKISSYTRKTLLQVFRVGEDTFILGFPGEMISETSLLIKKALLGLHVIISTYTNDYIGYVPTERFFNSGKYEARTALWSIVERNVEFTLRREIIDLIRRV